jgi:hypothetical protein
MEYTLGIIYNEHEDTYVLVLLNRSVLFDGRQWPHGRMWDNGWEYVDGEDKDMLDYIWETANNCAPKDVYYTYTDKNTEEEREAYSSCVIMPYILVSRWVNKYFPQKKGQVYDLKRKQVS